MDSKVFKQLMKDPNYDIKCDIDEIQGQSFMLADKAKIQSSFRMIVVIEELQELAKCLCKTLRYGLKGNKKAVNKYSLLEEIADVTIGLDTIKREFGISEEDVHKAVVIKLKELDRRDHEIIQELAAKKEEKKRLKEEQAKPIEKQITKAK